MVCVSKQTADGTSLAVQWLGIRASTAGGAVSIPVWRTKYLPAARAGCAAKDVLVFLGPFSASSVQTLSTRNGYCLKQYLPQTDFFPAPATRLKTTGTNILGRYQDLSLLKINPILIFAKEAPAATSCHIYFPAFFSLWFPSMPRLPVRPAYVPRHIVMISWLRWPSSSRIQAGGTALLYMSVKGFTPFQGVVCISLSLAILPYICLGWCHSCTPVLVLGPLFWVKGNRREGGRKIILSCASCHYPTHRCVCEVLFFFFIEVVDL